MKKDSVLQRGFTPRPGAKERVWQQIQAAQTARPAYGRKLAWAGACAVVLLAAWGLFHTPQQPSVQLAKASVYELGNKATPRGLEFSENYVPFE